MTTRQRAAMTDQQAPLRFEQSCWLPSAAKVAFTTAQSKSFHSNSTMIATLVAVISVVPAEPK